MTGSRDRAFADEWMEMAKSETRCEWCGDANRMPRIGLCPHCNEIRKKLLHTKNWVKKQSDGANHHKKFFLDYELRIVEEQKKSCISDGKSLNGILSGDVSPLDLERWFRWIAGRIVSKTRLHKNIATQLGWAFTPHQRRVIAYLLWKIFHADARRNRWHRAVSRAGYE